MYRTVGTVLKVSEGCVGWNLKNWQEKEFSFTDKVDLKSHYFRDPFFFNEWCFYYDKGKSEFGVFRRKEAVTGSFLLTVEVFIRAIDDQKFERFSVSNIGRSTLYRHPAFHKFFFRITDIREPAEIFCTFLKIVDLEDTILPLAVDESRKSYAYGNRTSYGEKANVDQKNKDNTLWTSWRAASVMPPSIKEDPTTKDLETLCDAMKTLFISGEDSDVLFKVADQKYPAHKLILKARSLVFRSMLKQDMLDKSSNTIDITDCDPKLFKSFLSYLYSGNVDNITIEKAFDFFHLADRFEVKDLKDICGKFIARNLTVDTICDALILAMKDCRLEVMGRATDFFVANAHEILPTAKWKDFVRDNPKKANELFIKAFNSRE